MNQEDINKLIVKAVDSINKSIDYLEQCVEDDESEHEDLNDIADILNEACNMLKDR